MLTTTVSHGPYACHVTIYPGREAVTAYCHTFKDTGDGVEEMPSVRLVLSGYCAAEAVYHTVSAALEPHGVAIAWEEFDGNDACECHLDEED